MHTFQRPRITRSLSDHESPDVKLQQQPQPKRPSTTQSALGTSTRPLSTVVKAPAPQRPPRNPARSDTVPLPAPIPAVAANRAIATVAAGIDARPRTATGFREDVTPWELYPVPDYAFAESSRPGHNRVSISSRPTTSSGRPSSSGGRPSGLNFTEGLVRRRKSTGAKPVKLHAPKPIMGTGTSKPHALSHPTHKSTSPPPSSFFPLSSNVYAGPFLAPASVVIPKLPPLPPPKPAEKHYPTDNNLKFSTADRTILEELKRNIKAREAQFIVKGGTSGCGKPGFGPDGRDGWGVGSLGGIGVMGGRKHHPFHKEEVPYPRSYEREVLDLDIWETSFCQQICDSTTWHVFDTPPKKVLDIGCGTGAWILNCARAWRECHFVGLDIVPLHPDLHQVGSIDLAQRITWTQGNFLEFLPFPNEEFDYVHIKRIALGVPEDKWDHLFEEITRVMKPGGAFEMIEEDLFFPGHSPDEGDDDDSDIESESRSSVELRRQSGNSKPYSTTSRSSDHDHDDADTDSTMPTSMYDSGISARQSEEVGTSFVDIPSPGYLSSGSAVSLSGSPILPSTNASVTGTTIAEDDEERTDNDGTITQASHIQRRSLSSIMTPSTALPPKASSSKSRQKAEPFEHTVQPQKLHAASSISLHATNTKHSLTAPPVTRPRRMSLSTSTPPPPRRTSSFHADITHRPPQPPPFLSRSIKPPPNPRDHIILETIYNEMQASRFINLSPLSLLPNYLNQYFTDIRTHPPLQFAFPPLPLKIKVPEVVEDEWDPDQEARNAINPFPAKSPERRLSLDSVLGDEERWLSARNLLNRSSQFVSLDDSRFSGVSPRASGFPALPTVDPQPTSSPSIPPSKPSSLIKHTLPNKKLSIDVKALNLHLALRRAEILGCSEEMWEWVLEFQAELRRKRKEEASTRAMKERSKSVDMTRSPTLRGRPHSIGGRTWHEPQGPKAEIAELAREDFEELLSRFDMDMSDHIALGSQVESRFSWSSFKSAPSAERKSFDAACERYERWQGEPQQENFVSRPTSSDGSHRDSNGLPGPSEHLLLRERTHRPDSFRGIQQLMPPNTTSFGSTRRLCRTIGVFVAWKPSSPTDDDSD